MCSQCNLTVKHLFMYIYNIVKVVICCHLVPHHILQHVTYFANAKHNRQRSAKEGSTELEEGQELYIDVHCAGELNH